jgi:hypothetical protein
MNFPTSIERGLFDSLSPATKAELAIRKPFECEYCGLTMAIEDGFCDKDCEQAFYDTATAEELRAWEAKNGIEPVKNLADEAGRREDAAEAQHEHAREDFEARLDKMIDQAIEAKQIERKESHDQDA